MNKSDKISTAQKPVPADHNGGYLKTSFSIIGGGIAGLTTAIALQNIGINAYVFEAAPEFKPLGAGLVLAANAMRAYHHLGIFDELVSVGNQIKQATIYDQEGKIINRINTDNLKNELANLAIHRAELHKVLLSKLKNEYIINGKRSIDYTTNDYRYRVVFEDGFTLDTKYLIVAEGVHSSIREKLLPKAEVRYSGYTCWRGTADNTTLKIEETTETWGTKGRFGMVPLGNNKIYWYATKNADPNDQKMKSFGPNELLENFKGYHQPIERVIQSTPLSQIIWNDIIDLKPIKNYAFGNLVLIGDAAHATTPNMGQGACQAIEDAVILANCLKKNSIVKEAFSDFQKRRLKRTHEIVNQSWRLGKIAQLENPLASSLRNLVFRSIPQGIYRKQVESIYNVSFEN
ncbi:FAD-dependent monooxygenase [soil metagenome]